MPERDIECEARKRQARNLAEVEALLRRAREQEEEEQFFASIRSRCQGDGSRATPQEVLKTSTPPRAEVRLPAPAATLHVDAAAAGRFVRHHSRRSPMRAAQAQGTTRDLPLALERHYELLGLRPGTPALDVHAAYKRLGTTMGDEDGSRAKRFQSRPSLNLLQLLSADYDNNKHERKIIAVSLRLDSQTDARGARRQRCVEDFSEFSWIAMKEWENPGWKPELAQPWDPGQGVNLDVGNVSQRPLMENGRLDSRRAMTEAGYLQCFQGLAALALGRREAERPAVARSKSSEDLLALLPSPEVTTTVLDFLQPSVLGILAGACSSCRLLADSEAVWHKACVRTWASKQHSARMRSWLAESGPEKASSDSCARSEEESWKARYVFALKDRHRCRILPEELCWDSGRDEMGRPLPRRWHLKMHLGRWVDKEVIFSPGGGSFADFDFRVLNFRVFQELPWRPHPGTDGPWEDSGPGFVGQEPEADEEDDEDDVEEDSPDEGEDDEDEEEPDETQLLSETEREEGQGSASEASPRAPRNEAEDFEDLPDSDSSIHTSQSRPRRRILGSPAAQSSLPPLTSLPTPTLMDMDLSFNRSFGRDRDRPLLRHTLAWGSRRAASEAAAAAAAAAGHADVVSVHLAEIREEGERGTWRMGQSGGGYLQYRVETDELLRPGAVARRGRLLHFGRRFADGRGVELVSCYPLQWDASESHLSERRLPVSEALGPWCLCRCPWPLCHFRPQPQIALHSRAECSTQLLVCGLLPVCSGSCAPPSCALRFGLQPSRGHT
ncbi:unnamed protein product [Symbiodinium microadriaticum]|nr:unnamed protein product [Symbiodinium microadriaticum]